MESTEGLETFQEHFAAGASVSAPVILTSGDGPLDESSLEDVKGPIRDAAHSAAPEGTEAFVGGTPSVFADLRDAMARDYSIVFPVTAVVIMLILAATFASLMLSGNTVMVSMGFALSLAIIVAAFRDCRCSSPPPFFTPALTALIGHAAWWPGHRDEPAGPEETTLPEPEGAPATR